MGLFNLFKGQSNPKLDLSNFQFISDDHIRYENGRNVSGNNTDCFRGIEVKNNISGKEGYTVTMYNLDGIHPVWGNNIQMAPKQMKILSQTEHLINLRGFGKDNMGNTFEDYGLAIYINKNIVEKITLHMFDHSIHIDYFPAKKSKPSNKPTFAEIDAEFGKGVNHMRNGDYSAAIISFKNTLALKDASTIANDEFESSCSFNLAESLKQLELYEDAILYYKRAISKKTMNEDAYIGLSECFFFQDTLESYQKAADILNICTKYFPYNTTAHYNSGIAYFKLNEHKKALSSFLKVKELGSDEADLYIVLLKSL